MRVGEFSAKLGKMRMEASKALQLGLNMGGLFLQRESQKLVPIDTDTLRLSAQTRPDPINGRPSTVVEYGTDYGIYVHKNLEARHAPGTQAKFLEQPFREKMDRIVEIIAETTKAHI